MGVMNTGAAKGTVTDGFLENNDKAFATDDKGKYLYPDLHKRDAAKIKAVFENNIQAPKAIGAISAGFLGGDLLPGHREALKSLLTGDKCPTKMLLVWGTKDVVCPHKYAAEVVAMNPKVVELVSPELGHESLSEDPRMIAQHIVDGMKGV